MMTLFIDTSQSDVSIAIVLDKKILASRCMRIPNKHSIYTVSFIDEVLKEASVSSDDVDKIMVVNGPGSFTGVRIGLTIAKVYAYIKNIPLVCLSSLKILALSTNHDYCLSIIDAKHDNYYIGLYDKNNNEVIPEQFANITYVRQLISKYDPEIVSYDEFKLDDLVVSSIKLNILEIVSYYEKMKSVNVHLAVPNYLKLPQALEGKNV